MCSYDICHWYINILYVVKLNGELMELMKRISVLIVLAMVAITMAVFVSTVTAHGGKIRIKFYGTITDAEGNPYVGHTVEIKKECNGRWRSMGRDVTDRNGNYSIKHKLKGDDKEDTYKMFIDGEEVDERYIDDWTYEDEGRKRFITYWSYRWDYQYQIPEFTNIAIPAAAMLGLLFIFNHRKRRK